MTSVKRCNCTHAWQDRHYGIGMRLHNAMKKDSRGEQPWRCSVCANMRY